MTGDLQRRLLAGRHRACMSGGMLSACLSCKELTEAADEIKRLREALKYIRQRGYTGASYVADKALRNESWE